MTNWAEVTTFLTKNYTTMRMDPEQYAVEMGTRDGRTQVAYVQRRVDRDGDEWIVIESPFGMAADMELDTACSNVRLVPCGGIAVAGDGRVLVRHAAPILNINANEINKPLRVVLGVADQLERDLYGTDEY